MKIYQPEMKAAIERLCQELLPQEPTGLKHAAIPRHSEGSWHLADAWTEEAQLQWNPLDAPNDETGCRDVNHYKDFEIPGTSAIAMIEEISETKSLLTIVSEEEAMAGTRVKFELGGGLSGCVMLLKNYGLCRGHYELAVAWTDLDFSQARFEVSTREESA